MENIIEFTGFKTNHSLYDEDAIKVLEDLPKEEREIIRKAFELSMSKYLTELSKPIDVHIHPESTKEQIESISSAIKKLQETCKELMQQLGVAKAAEALRAHNNS